MNRPIYSFCYISQTPQNSQHHSRALPIRSSSSRKITPIKQTLMRADQIKPSTIGIPKSLSSSAYSFILFKKNNPDQADPYES